MANILFNRQFVLKTSTVAVRLFASELGKLEVIEWYVLRACLTRLCTYVCIYIYISIIFFKGGLTNPCKLWSFAHFFHLTPKLHGLVHPTPHDPAINNVWQSFDPGAGGPVAERCE